MAVTAEAIEQLRPIAEEAGPIDDAQADSLLVLIGGDAPALAATA